MSIGFNKIALLELFSSSPKIMSDEQFFEYQTKDFFDCTLKLHFATFDEYAVVTLKNKEETIYNIGVDNVAEIVAEKGLLKIFTDGDEQAPAIQVRWVLNIIPFSSEFMLKNNPTQTQQAVPPASHCTSFIKFDDFSLMALFCNEPQTVDQEAKIFEYRINDNHGFELSLYFAVHDGYAIVQLAFEDQLVYKITMDSITEIKAEKDCFKIFVKENDEERIIQVMVIPNFSDGTSLFTLKEFYEQ